MKRFLKLLELSGGIILLLVVLVLLATRPTFPAEKSIFFFSAYYFIYGMILGLERQEDDERWRFLVPKTILWGIIWPFILIGIVADLWLENLDTGLAVAFA